MSGAVFCIDAKMCCICFVLLDSIATVTYIINYIYIIINNYIHNYYITY